MTLDIQKFLEAVSNSEKADKITIILDPVPPIRTAMAVQKRSPFTCPVFVRGLWSSTNRGCTGWLSGRRITMWCVPEIFRDNFVEIDPKIVASIGSGIIQQLKERTVLSACKIPTIQHHAVQIQELMDEQRNAHVKTRMLGIWNIRSLIGNLVQLELTSGVARRKFGLFWWLLDPILLLGIYWVLVVVILDVRRSVDGPIHCFCAPPSFCGNGFQHRSVAVVRPGWSSTPDQISFSSEGGISYFDRVGVMYSMDTWNIHPFRSVFGIWTANIQPELAAELVPALYLVCDTCKWRNNHVSSHSLFSRLGWFDTACLKSRLTYRQVFGHWSCYPKGCPMLPAPFICG